MLFNSYAFIFVFLPIVFMGFFVLGRQSTKLAAAWLGLSSLFFYGYWSVKALPLLLASIVVNYAFGQILIKRHQGYGHPFFLWVAVTSNLALLAFFKYANFFIDNANMILDSAGHSTFSTLDIVLPIGISFFTFTQIAFLVDCWQGKAKEQDFVHYLLFVTYFPHLIAGPVLHHGQMMPQFKKASTYRMDMDKISTGLTIFSVGLAKKLLIADPLSTTADALFNTAGAVGAAAMVSEPSFFFSWAGVLAYTFQIYFDFSGYSDMAIGISLLFGISLPINFNSPYQSTSIIEFWRRWHISLSTFLRDYLYIPLGGNKQGMLRRYMNLFITMVLGGLWHGANWTFVLWGAAHGALLTFNHAWRWLWKMIGSDSGAVLQKGTRFSVSKLFSWLITFVSVCFTWVLFRANSVSDALTIYKGMFGLNGISLPINTADKFGGLTQFLASWMPGVVRYEGLLDNAMNINVFSLFITLISGMLIAFGLKNVNQFQLKSSSVGMASGASVLSRPLWIGMYVGALYFLCLLSMAQSHQAQFLYFQF